MRNKMKALSLLATATMIGIGTLAVAGTSNAAPRTVRPPVSVEGSFYPSPSVWLPSGKPTVRPCYPRPCAVNPLTVGRR